MIAKLITFDELQKICQWREDESGECLTEHPDDIRGVDIYHNVSGLCRHADRCPIWKELGENIGWVRI
jgi:hypothetical protein